MSDGIVLRAFELARSGRCVDLTDLRRELKKEGYSAIEEHLAGPTIKKQLSAAIKVGQSPA